MTAPRRRLPAPAVDCAAILGILLAALLCLGFGDALATWAGVQ
jgi:dolichol kinase